MSYFRTDFKPSTEESLSAKLFIPDVLHESRLKSAVELFSQHIPKVTVLDVGCGYGHLYPHIKGATSHYLGIDPDAEAVEHANQTHGKMFEVGGLETLKPSMAADVVFCLGVTGLLLPTQEALVWMIEQLCSVAKKAVILEIQDSAKYKGFFTSFSQQQVSDACQRQFNRRTFLAREDDSVFHVRIPLV